MRTVSGKPWWSIFSLDMDLNQSSGTTLNLSVSWDLVIPFKLDKVQLFVAEYIFRSVTAKNFGTLKLWTNRKFIMQLRLESKLCKKIKYIHLQVSLLWFIYICSCKFRFEWAPKLVCWQIFMLLLWAFIFADAKISTLHALQSIHLITMPSLAQAVTMSSLETSVQQNMY